VARTLGELDVPSTREVVPVQPIERETRIPSNI
ncbi:MAG: hypothetical protein JWN41_1006, partial [Thermoleophilia bacterium]|nr:hypothetical protein [Thermoleophilia bacterium]